VNDPTLIAPSPPVSAAVSEPSRFPLVQYESMGEKVYAQLSSALMEGKLKPADRLRIRELAAELGTSVTPVRDAILRLVQDGALVMRSPRDIRVAELSLAQYLEIRDIRLDLEGMAAARAAHAASPEDVRHIESLIAENEHALRIGDLQTAVGLNQRFHFEYCRIAKMSVLQGILERLWLKMGPLIAQCYSEGGRDMIDGHYALLKAMQSQDSQAARIAIQTDILSGGQVILELKKREKAGVERES
jgi:DNA-binding GntR family transcriptional regulator